ncbi:CD209 antigen-like isoform X2 [Cebidichthys violaceus]|uniref:CD209 antigen-like isoform X2 n=1 Tax=Cebidichthys violaceus TaxID=271503 RepID=UPI0035CAF4BB
MTEDIYAKPDLTKKVRFQTGVKEDRDTDVCDDIDNVRIYDNFCAEESTPPEKSQDNITEDQQQISVNVSSEKRNVFGAAAVLLGLLCLLLLMAVIVLVVLYVVERNRLWEKNSNLQTRYSEMKSLNVNLTSERDKLQTRYSDEKGLNHNLTLKMNQLEEEKNHLKATNNNLTIERDELQKLLDERTCCPNKWTRFGNSCYLKSTSKANWIDSKEVCEDDDAQLVIISSQEEQEFISSFMGQTWIGLTDEKREDGVWNWEWVDGTPLTETYWRDGQPDNLNEENYVEISDGLGNNWNNLPDNFQRYFTCEKVLE